MSISGDKILQDFLETKRQSKFITHHPNLALIAQVRCYYYIFEYVFV